MATAPAPKPASRGNPTVDAAQFEALFIRSLKSPPELLECFKARGFDASRMEPIYPMSVFTLCVEDAVAYFHPGVPFERGSWLMGRAFLRGYFDTMVGGVIKAASAMLSPAQLLKRMPTFMKAGSAQIPVTVVEEGPQRFRLQFVTLSEVTPEYMAGIIEEAVRGRNVEPALALEKRAPGEFDVLVSW